MFHVLEIIFLEFNMDPFYSLYCYYKITELSIYKGCQKVQFRNEYSKLQILGHLPTVVWLNSKVQLLWNQSWRTEELETETK